MSAVREFLASALGRRVDPQSTDWLEKAACEIACGAPNARFCALLSTASRWIPRRPWTPTVEEITHAFDLVEGWNPERWTLLEATRVLLVLSRADLEKESSVAAIEEAFRYADMGEMCALHRSLALLPRPERFVWRAGEGCRSSLRAVYEAAACDTPFPVKNFDDLAWRQLVIKALFVEAPLWRVYGLDTRLDAELARMALDLAEERRAAGRNVQHELWLVLGKVSGERGLESIERELAGSFQLGRRAASIALARAGQMSRLSELCQIERDPIVAETMRSALKGRIHSGAFRDFDPTLAQANS
jgi:hypothetical protein